MIDLPDYLFRLRRNYLHTLVNGKRAQLKSLWIELHMRHSQKPQGISNVLNGGSWWYLTYVIENS